MSSTGAIAHFVCTWCGHDDFWVHKYKIFIERIAEAMGLVDAVFCQAVVCAPAD